MKKIINILCLSLVCMVQVMIGSDRHLHNVGREDALEARRQIEQLLNDGRLVAGTASQNNNPDQIRRATRYEREVGEALREIIVGHDAATNHGGEPVEGRVITNHNDRPDRIRLLFSKEVMLNVCLPVAVGIAGGCAMLYLEHCTGEGYQAKYNLLRDFNVC